MSWCMARIENQVLSVVRCCRWTLYETNFKKYINQKLFYVTLTFLFSCFSSSLMATAGGWTFQPWPQSSLTISTENDNNFFPPAVLRLSSRLRLRCVLYEGWLLPCWIWVQSQRWITVWNWTCESLTLPTLNTNSRPAISQHVSIFFLF